MNLLPAIKTICTQISELEHKHRQELQPYRESLNSLRNINTACEECNGTGKLRHRTCAEDEGSYYACEACRGTGETKPLPAETGGSPMSQKTAKRLRRLEAEQRHQLHMYIKVVNRMAQMRYQLDSLDTLQKFRDKKEGNTMGFAFECKHCGAIAYITRRWFVRCIVCGKVHVFAKKQ